MDCTALWLLPCSLGIPPTIMDLMKSLYTDMVGCLTADGGLTEWFEVWSEVKQGYTSDANLPVNYVFGILPVKNENLILLNTVAKIY